MYLTPVVNVLVLMVVQVLMWTFAGLRQQSVCFGVRVPPEQINGPTLLRARRIFRVSVLASTVIALPMVVFATMAGRPFLDLLVVLVTLAGDLIFFSVARRSVMEAKAAERWYADRQQMVAVAIAPPAPLGGLRWSWLLPSLVVITATAVAAVLRYAHLPTRMVLHFDTSGNPDWMVPTTPLTALLPVMEQVVLTVTLFVAAVAVRRRPAELDPAGCETATTEANTQPARLSAALLALSLCTNISLALMGVQQWWGGASLRWPLLIGALTATILGIAVVASSGVGGGKRIAVRGPADASASVWRDDDRFWRGGLIYHNPDDPRLVVPKRFGLGLTFNFAHPNAWWFTGLLLALPIASFIAAALLGR